MNFKQAFLACFGYQTQLRGGAAGVLDHFRTQERNERELFEKLGSTGLAAAKYLGFQDNASKRKLKKQGKELFKAFENLFQNENRNLNRDREDRNGNCFGR